MPSLYIRPVKDASTLVNDVRDKAVGFHVAWTTVGWNDFGVCLNDHPPALLRTDTYLGETVKIYDCNAAEAHPLERLLLRSLTAGRHTYIGAYGNGFFAWRGRVFALGERDVQQLAGHANLGTTQRYIDGDSEAKRKVVALI